MSNDGLRFSDLEQARKHLHESIELVVDESWTTPWQSVVHEFKNLKGLSLRGNLDATSVHSWPKSLVSLKMVIKDHDSLAPFIDALPQLEHLEIWGRHLKKGTLSDDVKKLSELRSLVLVSCGLRELPETLTELKKLTHLELRGLPMTVFPNVISKLTTLKSLDFQNRVLKLPDDLENLKALEKLNLSGALNGGTMDAAELSSAQLRPLPKVLAALTELQQLCLDCCGLVDRDLEVVSRLSKLTYFSSQFSGIRDASALQNLSALTHLKLTYAYNLESETLGIKSLTHLDVSDSNVQSLDFLESTPHLSSLNIESCHLGSIDALFSNRSLQTLVADKEIQESFAKRDSLRLLDKDQIIALLKSDDLVEVERGIAHCATWVEAKSSRRKNAMRELFSFEGGDDDEEAAVPVLGPALDLHVDRLSTASLLHVIRAGFRSSYDNFDVTNKALSVLSLRGDVEAELEVVKIFQKACEYYDAGHRYWGATTLDNFSDDYFRNFSPQALSVLLAGLGTDALNSKYGDAMDALFVCAFKGADEETKTKLSNTLIDYAQEAVEYYGALYFKKLISECEQAYGAPLETLAHTLNDLESLAQWTKRLNEEPSSVNQLLNQWLEGGLSQAHKETLETDAKNALQKLAQESREMRERALDFAFELKEFSWMRGGDLADPAHRSAT